jgi:zinc protease
VAVPLVATPSEGYSNGPTAAPIVRTALSTPSEFVLDNGLHVLVVPRRDMPLVAIVLASRASGSSDSAAVPGIDLLLRRVMNAEAASIADSGRPYTDIVSTGAIIDCDVTVESTADALRSIATLVREPRFDRNLVARKRRELDRDIGTTSNTIGELVERHLDEMLYGVEDPRARTWYGDRDVFRRLNRDVLLARHRALFAPADTALIVVGDVDIGEIQALAEQTLGAWQHAAEPVTWMSAPAFPIPGARLHGIPTFSTESVIELRERAPHASHQDRPGFEVLEALLGGMFSARINRVLREERGHTYGVAASTSYLRDHSYFRIQLAVPASATRSTVFALIDELRRVSDPAQIDPGELERARAHALGSARGSFRSRRGVAYTLATYFLRHDSFDALTARMERIAMIDREEVARIARTWLRPEAAPIVVHGDSRYLFFSMNGIPGGYEFVSDP